MCRNSLANLSIVAGFLLQRVLLLQGSPVHHRSVVRLCGPGTEIGPEIRFCGGGPAGLLHGRCHVQETTAGLKDCTVPYCTYLRVHVILNPVLYHPRCTRGECGASLPHTKGRLGPQYCIHKTVQSPRGVIVYKSIVGTSGTYLHRYAMRVEN